MNTGVHGPWVVEAEGAKDGPAAMASVGAEPDALPSERRRRTTGTAADMSPVPTVTRAAVIPSSPLGHYPRLGLTSIENLALLVASEC